LTQQGELHSCQIRAKQVSGSGCYKSIAGAPNNHRAAAKMAGE